MANRKHFAFFLFIVIVVICFKCYDATKASWSNVADQNHFPRPHTTKRMTKESSRREFCSGRRCFRTDPSDSFIKNQISIVVVILIGIAVQLTIRNEKKHKAAKAFKRVAHSTSILESSLSLSPIPWSPTTHQHQNEASTHQCVNEANANSLLQTHDFEDIDQFISSLALTSDYSCCDSSCTCSVSGIIPSVPPKRWRANSKLNEASSNDVLPQDLYYCF